MKTSYFIKGAAMSVLCFFSFQLNAQVVDGINYKIIEDGAAVEVTPLAVNGDGYPTTFYTQETINIPANVTIGGKNYPVKRIGTNSMRDNKNLKSLTIAEGVQVVGNSAFASCENLPSVILPASVIKIEEWSFHGCKSLVSINIPDGVPAIEGHTFQETALKEVKLPSSVKTLGVCAFQNTPLTAINLEYVEKLDSYTLYGSHLSGDIVLPEVTSMGNEEFGECNFITSITMPKVTSMGNWVFKQSAMLETVTLPNVTQSGNYLFDGTKSIKTFIAPKLSNTGNQSFQNCVNLETVDISSVSNIGAWAFQGCEKLANLKTGENLSFISDGALSGCASLTSLTIPASVEYIGEWALEKTGLTEVFISWEDLAPIFISDDALGNGDGAATFTWKVPEELYDTYGPEWLGLPVEIGTPSSIANEEVDQVYAYYADGYLTLSNLEGQTVSVISIDGRVVSTFIVEDRYTEVPVTLNSGVYVLKANKASVKFIVR